MKKLINNKKGFTLIELLAVIVILAILVMVSIPAVMRYLDTARKGTFSDAAATAVSAVRNDVIINGIQGKKTYTLGKTDQNGKYAEGTINNLLEQKLTNSPYGKQYNESSYITVDVNNENTTYHICLTDGVKGINVDSSQIDKSQVTDMATCTPTS